MLCDASPLQRKDYFLSEFSTIAANDRSENSLAAADVHAHLMDAVRPRAMDDEDERSLQDVQNLGCELNSMFFTHLLPCMGLAMGHPVWMTTFT
eukprot:15384560-Alexandrium_andersonii.AAC.1